MRKYYSFTAKLFDGREMYLETNSNSESEALIVRNFLLENYDVETLTSITPEGKVTSELINDEAIFDEIWDLMFAKHSGELSNRSAYRLVLLADKVNLTLDQIQEQFDEMRREFAE